MDNQKTNIFPSVIIFSAIIAAGFISPSNGVDAGSGKTSEQLIFTMFACIIAGLAFYLFSTFIEKQKAKAEH